MHYIIFLKKNESSRRSVCSLYEVACCLYKVANHLMWLVRGRCVVCAWLHVNRGDLVRTKIDFGKSIHGFFSAVLAFVFVKIRMTVCSMTMRDVAIFGRDVNIHMKDIHDFTETVRLNEMGIVYILQSEPMKLRPSHHCA